MQQNYFLMIGSLSGMLAVMLGAFGAHGLEKLVDAKMLQRFHTGVEYQFYHSLALLIINIFYIQMKNKLINYAGHAFTLGIVLFSGSLYVYVLTGYKSIAAVTPVGGASFIIGWALVFIAALNSFNSEKI